MNFALVQAHFGAVYTINISGKGDTIPRLEKVKNQLKADPPQDMALISRQGLGTELFTHILTGEDFSFLKRKLGISMGNNTKGIEVMDLKAATISASKIIGKLQNFIRFRIDPFYEDEIELSLEQVEKELKIGTFLKEV